SFQWPSDQVRGRVRAYGTNSACQLHPPPVTPAKAGAHPEIPAHALRGSFISLTPGPWHQRHHPHTPCPALGRDPRAILHLSNSFHWPSDQVRGRVRAYGTNAECPAPPTACHPSESRVPS